MTARARALSSRLHAARPAVAYVAVSVAPPVILPINTEAGTTLVIDFATRAPVPSVELDMPQPLLVLVAPMIEREPKPAGARMGMLASTAAHGLILVALVIGLVISLLQALTQIQEQTLVFVPKIIAVFASMMLFLPFMGDALASYMMRIAARIAAGG